MKHVFLLLSSVLIISCNVEKKPDYALLSGKIINPLSSEVSIRDNNGETIFVSKLNDDGTFNDTIFNVDGFYSFKAGNEMTEIYLKKGYNLNIEIDTKEFDETVTYSGLGSEVNNYQAQKFLLNEKNTGNTGELFLLEEGDFLSKNDMNFKALYELADAIEDNAFKKIAKDNLKIEKATNLAQYEGYHGYLTKNKDFRVSENFPNPYEGIDLTDTNLYENNQSFKYLVHNKFFYDIGLESKEKDSDIITLAYEKVIEMPANVIRDGLIENLFNQKEMFKKENKETADALLSLVTDQDLQNKLSKELELMSKLGKGNKSPEFVNYENYNGNKTSLSDLKGKYIYIDVWATWCGPCKVEIPYLKKLEEQYRNKDIQFVSISVDREQDKDKWREMIKENEMKGVQLFADKDWKSDFVINYGIKGIPTFILIDPDGNIVTASAPRPSNPELIELFDELKI